MRKASVTRPVDSHNAFDLFQFFFLDEQLKILVGNTNKNAHKKARKKQGAYSGGTNLKEKEIGRWIDTNVKELYLFFGVYVYKGVHPEPHRTDYC